MKTLVGRIGISDNVATLSFGAFVEMTPTYTDSLFLMSIKKHGGSSVPMKFNAVETRAFLYALSILAKDRSYAYSKQSGGSNRICHLNASANNNYHYIGLTRDEEAQISFKEFELIGFIQEVKKLCELTAESLYKIQRLIDKGTITPDMQEQYNKGN